MEKEKIISALLEKGDEYTNIDFSGFKKRVRDAMKMRGINQKETAQMVDVSEKLISQLVNECQMYSRPKDGTLERFFRQIDVLALTLDVSPIWLKYEIGEMENNAISFDETKKDAVAGEDAAARLPIDYEMDAENIARSIASIALTLPEKIYSLSICNVQTGAPLGENKNSLALQLLIDLWKLDDDGCFPILSESGKYFKYYFGEFDKLLRARSLFSEQDMVDKTEYIFEMARGVLPYRGKNYVMSDGGLIPF